MKKLINYFGVLVIALIASTGVTNAQQVISGTVMEGVFSVPLIALFLVLLGWC